MNIQSCSRRSRARAAALAVSLVLVASTTLLAAPTGAGFALQGSVIASGGVSRATATCFDLSATIGEPTAGVASGGGFELVSGFWSAPVVRDELFRSSFEGCTP
ncbi:hypothetical protein [Dokdonella sp.]|uniref:hypothetical protein n=1 Tax=Dokdonella sp. TaxID=2291710 RepID=UPI002F40BA01